MIEKLTGQKIVCPWWLCFTFDNRLRRLLHAPKQILSPYVRPGDSAIDVGAGMGYFSVPLAELVGSSGCVTSIDVQPQMLSVLTKRAKRANVSDRITTHLATEESLGDHSPADFVLAFWVVHEISDHYRFLHQIQNLLKPDGLFLLVEPIVHVPKRSFAKTLETAKTLGFTIKGNPNIRLSHSILLSPP